MSNDYQCCNDCGAMTEINYRQLFGCYLCNDCYTEALLEEDDEIYDDEDELDDYA